jgi:steroid delta-isomerase-like uncharacterized protein
MPDNVQIARSYFEELFGKGKLDFVDRNVDPAFKGHETLLEEYGRDEVKRNAQMYRNGFPDLSVAIDEALAAGEKVLIRWSAKGTHRGSFLGRPPTGKQMDVHGISVITFRNGKIVEEWTQWDALGLLQDLGIAPRIEQPGATASA